jgi:TatD DNase family protein
MEFTMKSMPSFFDSHAHLGDDSLYPNIDSLLYEASASGVKGIINICTDLITLKRGLEIEKKYPWVRNAAATTPHDVAKEGEEVFPYIAEEAKKGNLIAIGETGLDYFYHHSPADVQQTFLRRYLRLALECHLPVIIHCRDAFADFFRILDEEYAPEGKHAPGVLHCFTGTVSEAEEVIARGWYLSLSGIVTFKKSSELRVVAEKVPLDQLLIETDAPYLAPQAYRGKLNCPAYVVETAKCIAELKGISIEELSEATSRNAKKLFQIS